MTDDLAKKRNIRGGHRGSATKTMNKVTEALRADPIDVRGLALLKLTVSEKLDTIKTLDAEVVALTDGEAALLAEIEQADEYRERMHDALLRIDAALKDVAKDTTPATPATAHAAGGSSTAKLPRLKLKAFTGELTMWTPFWESLEAAIHTNTGLSAVEKFNYLISVLDGSAQESVSGLSLTAANYDEAVAILKKRFGSKQKIIDRHMDAMLSVAPVSSCEDIKGLRHLFDQVSSNIRCLKSLGVDSETYGCLLCPVLITKLPSELQLTLSRKIPEDQWKLDRILETIEEDIVARERVASVKPRRDSRTPHSAAALTSTSKTLTTVSCCYCGQNHKPTDCGTVKDVEARKEVLRKHGRCYVCLRRGHLSRHCRSSFRCLTCNGRHHASICVPTPPKDQPSKGPSSSAGTGDAKAPSAPVQTTSSLNPSAPEFMPSTNDTSLYLDASKTVILQTAVAEVYNPHDNSRRCGVRVVLDGGSQRSYLCQQVKQKLRLKPSGMQKLAIAAFGSRRAQAKSCEVVTLAINTRSSEALKIDLFVVPHICDPIAPQPMSVCAEQFSQFSGLEFADNGDDCEPLSVDVLLGSDVYWKIVTGEIVRSSAGPVAINTKLGWILSGPVEPLENDSITSVNISTGHVLMVDSSTDALEKKLQSFWELESLGISKRDDPVQEQFEQKITMNEGRYKVALPWRKYHEPLGSNYELSHARLRGLLRRLKQNPDILAEYDKIIQDQQTRGIIEIVESSNVGEAGKVHYLPHHAVIRRDKETTKVRVVYDASSRTTGPSLNNCLHTGPKYNQKILQILLRFRLYSTAVVADIEKAFLMISVDPEDRDVLRFLWAKDLTAEEPEIITLRFARVVFGVSSSPFLLNATIQHHLNKYLKEKPDLVKKIQESIYVDDVVGGDKDEAGALKFYKGAKHLLKEGSFNLRKFVTNAPSLQQRIDKEESIANQEAQSTSGIVPSDETYADCSLPSATMVNQGEQKVLGVLWNTKDDILIFDL